MPNNEIVLENTPPLAELGIIPHKSCSKIAEKVNDYLLQWRQERKSDQLYLDVFIGNGLNQVVDDKLLAGEMTA